MIKIIQRFLEAEDGAEVAEVALLLGTVVVAVSVAINALSTALVNHFNNANNLF